ncbi:MAG: DnaJ domain-containing protein [Actinobacteria bacterium]|nr:DnaJ domain-containing protein [Actinomycetota bacterium]
MSDPWATLGVAATASVEEIRAAYRTSAQILHPDNFATSPPHVRLEAERRMTELNSAYEEALRAASTPSTASQRQAHTERTATRDAMVEIVTPPKLQGRGAVAQLLVRSDPTRTEMLVKEALEPLVWKMRWFHSRPGDLAGKFVKGTTRINFVVRYRARADGTLVEIDVDKDGFWANTQALENLWVERINAFAAAITAVASRRGSIS